MRTLLKNRRGELSGGIVGGILILVLGVAFLMVGLFLKSEIAGAVDRGDFSNASNSTWDSIVGNVDTAFELMGVALIVIGAAVIITILRSSF